jgi:periplasmic glucans biosynthesis protein
MTDCPVHPPASALFHCNRRAVLSGIALSLLPFAATAQQKNPQDLMQTMLGSGQNFSAALVTELARSLSKRPFIAANNDLPDVFSSLSYEAYIGIKALPVAHLWAGENRGFVVEPLHRGFVFGQNVALFTVEDGLSRRVLYDRAAFDFGKVSAPTSLPDLGFSGFRLHSTFGNGELIECALVQGATFFRSLARGQNFGVVSRALTLKPAESRGEEFPAFKAFWFERPQPGVQTLTVHGLIDSESASGAVRMTFRPGDISIIDVEMTLFPRVNLDHVGIAGMAASYLFGPNDRRNVDDARPAVYEVSGLNIVNGQGEWIWRPLQNPETLQISAFIDKNPRGFGLMQRERDYLTFQDDDQRFEKRPSLWVEPLGDWGEGVVQLIEIPSDSEVNDNVLSYWRPKAPLLAGSEVTLAYRQFWCWQLPERPALAQVTSTRIGRGSSGRKRRFFVDFSGDTLFSGIADIKPVLSATPGTLSDVKISAYPDRKTIRIAFELDPGNENASELRLVWEATGKPLSEIWLYRWTP